MSGGARWAATIGAAALTLLAAAAPAGARLRWSGCGDVEADCTALRVPLDRSGATPGTVRLRVARYTPPSRRPTLLYLSGGPGGAGVQEFSDVLFEVGGLSGRFDLVSFDQRGTGDSGLLRCRALERDDRLRSTAAAADCASRLGARRAFYTTRDSVEDVEAVRQALGVQKLTLFGISYGTKLALAYARAHPDRVERMALDSVLDPDDADAFGREPYQAMGPTLAALCPARCRGVSADPAADLARLADRLRTAPLRGVTYGARGRRRPGTLTALALSDLMFDSDYNPAIRAGIPVAVRAALDHGDAAPLLRLIDAAADLSRLPAPRVFSAARYATVCEETPLPWPRGTPFGERAQRAGEQAAALGPGAFFPFAYAEAKADEIDLCLHWPEASAPPPTGGAYPKGPRVRAPGRRGPAHAAGGLGARGGRAGRAAGRRARRRARGRGRGPVALRHPAPVLVPARAARQRGLPGRADGGARHRRAADLAGPARRGGRRAREGGADGGRARRHARRPHLRPLTGPWLAAGGRGAARRAFRLRRRSIALDGPPGGSWRPRQRPAAAARERAPADLGRARGPRPGADLGERRGARAARRAEGARAPAGGAAATGREPCAKRGEYGAIPAQDGVVFRPTPHLAFPLHFV